MGLTRALLEAVKLVLVVLIVGVGIGVGSGQAEPYLSPSAIPGGPPATFGGMLVGVVVVLVGIGWVQKRIKAGKWVPAGRQAGLRPDGSGSLPDLTGTVDGRTVRAGVTTRTVSTGSEGGSKTTVYTTSVETALDGPADDGLLLGGDWGKLDAEKGTLHFDDVAENAADVDDLAVVTAGDLVAVGTSEPLARAAASGPVQDALRSLGGLNLVYAGDAARVVARHAEARNEELEESMFGYDVDMLVESVPGDAATVTVETERLVRDGEELRRFAEAVVVVADAFEEASRRAPG